MRSYFFIDAYEFQFGQRTVTVESGGGSLGIQSISPSPFAPSPGWHSQSSSPRLRSPGFFESLFAFHFRSFKAAMPPGVQPVRFQMDAVPCWSVLVLSAIFPALMFLRDRVETKWTLTGNIIPALRWRVGRFAVFSAVGAGLGALFGWNGYPTRAQFGRGPLAPELFLLPGIAVILIILTRRRIRWHQALLWMALELAGLICFFEAVLDQAGHYWHGRFLRPEMIDQILGAGATSFVCGAMLLLLMQLRHQKRIPGPYCPQCGYCLIGLPSHRCTECGRPFTLEELKIDAAALNPAAPGG
jgi:hypothetical protein